MLDKDQTLENPRALQAGLELSSACSSVPTRSRECRSDNMNMTTFASTAHARAPCSCRTQSHALLRAHAGSPLPRLARRITRKIRANSDCSTHSDMSRTGSFVCLAQYRACMFLCVAPATAQISTSSCFHTGSTRPCAASAVSDKVGNMMHPAGPSILYPECKFLLDSIFEDLKAQDEQTALEGMAAGFASGVPEDPESVIETPPEWGAPDEGNPNQPRRPPEYQPPQARDKLECVCKLEHQWTGNHNGVCDA